LVLREGGLHSRHGLEMLVLGGFPAGAAGGGATGRVLPAASWIAAGNRLNGLVLL